VLFGAWPICTAGVALTGPFNPLPKQVPEKYGLTFPQLFDLTVLAREEIMLSVSTGWRKIGQRIPGLAKQKRKPGPILNQPFGLACGIWAEALDNRRALFPIRKAACLGNCDHEDLSEEFHR
jgi:hypothetical protein